MRKSRTSPVAARGRVVPIPEGITVLRYASAEDPASPPSVTVRPVDPSAKIEFIAAPGQPLDTLTAPGMVLVIRAQSASELSVVVKPMPGSHSAAAELKLERLISGDIPIKQIPALLQQPSQLTQPSSFKVLAHVAGRGDVVVPEGTWIAGPQLPAQIEGLQFQWTGKPADTDIECIATVGTRSMQRLPARRSAEFVGTRGRGLPITALGISLRGGDDQSLGLRVEALFLGAPLVSKNGREISLSGPTGREPLVGLRVSLDGALTQSGAESKFVAQHTPMTRSKDRVRIFRGPRAKAA